MNHLAPLPALARDGIRCPESRRSEPCRADRPEALAQGPDPPDISRDGDHATPLTHGGLDAHIETAGRAVDHLRALLVHHGLLPYRDPYLARFETWIEDKLRPLPPEVARPLEHFAKWHHLRRIRSASTPDIPARGPVHSANQEITETAKFLKWLWDTHRRTAATCTQQDVDEWRAHGPTTRKQIQTFFGFVSRTRLNTGVDVGRYAARTRPTLAQEQRLAWLRELLTGSSESRPYRVAGILLLLYAQPLVRVPALRTAAITIDPAAAQTSIAFTERPVPVPAPFAELLLDHLDARLNLRTVIAESPWLFPGTLAGQHLHPNGIMDRPLPRDPAHKRPQQRSGRARHPNVPATGSRRPRLQLPGSLQTRGVGRGKLGTIRQPPTATSYLTTGTPTHAVPAEVGPTSAPLRRAAGGQES